MPSNIYYLAKDRLPAYYKKPTQNPRCWANCTVRPCKGGNYEPLFPYFAGLQAKGAFRVLVGDFVTTDDGTGIVHMAPAFGEDDFGARQGGGLAVVRPVDDEGRFTSRVPDFADGK